jgi:hypothetical protein
MVHRWRGAAGSDWPLGGRQAHLPQWCLGSAQYHVGGSPQGRSHLWALKKANVNRNFVNWSYLSGQDYDGDYRYFEYASDNTQFWVYPD